MHTQSMELRDEKQKMLHLGCAGVSQVYLTFSSFTYSHSCRAFYKENREG